MSKSIYNLLPYQKRFVNDESRFIIGLWSRQTGKSFTTALKAVVECAEKPRSLWICLSAGERQSLEWMEKAKLHARAYGMAAEIEGDTFEADIQRLTIKFPNGSRIIGLPANPATARGYSGNVILDEFAFHEDSREIWRALVPAITRGYKLIVVSTPNGQGNMFHELWAAKNDFAKHKVTILDAAADGLAVDVKALQGAIDPDGWQQEYMCEFMDANSALLTYDMIAAAETDEAGEGTGAPRDIEYIGMDIGRQKDLTVIWRLAKVGDVFQTIEIRELDKCSFQAQLEVLSGYLRNPQVRRCCIDSTGLGMMLAEEAQRLHGAMKVEAVKFSGPVKEELAMGMLPVFQDKRIRIPRRREVREDLHKVCKTTTAAGNVRFDATRDANGHADRFWALALALHAGADKSGPVDGMRIKGDAKSVSPMAGGPDNSDDFAHSAQRGAW